MTLPVLDEGSETGDPENEPAHIRRTGYFLSGRYPGVQNVAKKAFHSRVVKAISGTAETLNKSRLPERGSERFAVNRHSSLSFFLFYHTLGCFSTLPTYYNSPK